MAFAAGSTADVLTWNVCAERQVGGERGEGSPGTGGRGLGGGGGSFFYGPSLVFSGSKLATW